MKNPRHQLILLGFICQGLSWDDYVLPLANTLVWALCLTVARKPLKINPAIEALALPFGVLAGYLLSVAMGQNTHFSIGHGITFVQAIRLMRPLAYREKVFSILMAFFQIGVACTVILDYRFLLIFAAALWLMPKAFMELESDKYGAAFTPSKPAPRPRLLAYVMIAGVSVLFFLFFPRGIIGSPIQLNRPRGDSGSLLDNVLDPTRSGAAQSSRIIFSVDGHNVGYLRCYALTEFDGIQWTSEERQYWQRPEPTAVEHLEEMPLRRVRAKSSAAFGRVLPTDGRVVYLRGTFFGRAWVNAQGMMEMENIRNIANNYYEYRINPHPKPERILPETAKRLVQYPPQSAALTNWLNQILKGATAPTEQARRMEAYLRDNFTYKLGAPELNRLAPVDDFVFNQKEGHCERFASTLALMLRMKGIPSRVVIGYLPMSRNWISGWYDIRFKDAHSWTEAYFKELGWVRLDATPGTSREQTTNLSDFMEAIDFAWYANVVNFDAATQKQLFAVSLEGLSSFGKWLEGHMRILIVGIPLLIIILIWYLRWYQGRDQESSPAKIRKQNQVLASHYYGQMLRALATKGVHRQPHITPLEFLTELEAQELPVVKDAQTITQFFCASRYGDKVISAEQKAEIETALERIRKTEMVAIAAGS